MTANEDLRIDLTGKHILITGGSMGIGYAAAEACLTAGADVAICARNADGIAEAVETLRAAHGTRHITGEQADVSAQDDVERLFKAVLRSFRKIDGVIHCAGIYGPIGKITEVDPDEWLEVLRVNLFGAFLITREACRVMSAQGSGRIVLLSGGGAASPFPNHSGYACSKVGVVRLVETIALEMQPCGIEINAIAPGFVATRLHEKTLVAGRQKSDAAFFEKTQEMLKGGAVSASVGGRAAAFFVSDATRGITGRFIAAPYDAWSTWPLHSEDFGSDNFTLRRIVPREDPQK